MSRSPQRLPLARLPRGAARLNAALTAVLLLGVVVLGNDLARRHLALRRDLSQDRLYAISDATQRILGRLEDRLQVTTYFTGDVKSGQLALAKADVEGQLTELSAIAGPRMEVVSLDPSSSIQAARDAAALGILARTLDADRGMQIVRQQVFLGMLLRYRGREQVLGFVDPLSFEVQFASAVYALVRDRRVKLGWYGAHEAGSGQLDRFRASFGEARSRLDIRHDLEDVQDLEYGEPVPADVEILFVVRPTDEHPRVAFELDQFVQRGGKLVVALDQAEYNYVTLERVGAGAGRPLPETGLDALLRAWGAPPTPQHVWDLNGKSEHFWLRYVGENPATGRTDWQREPVTTPIVVGVREQGLDAAHPITAGLRGAKLCWAQPIEPVPVPGGVERTDLIRSSPNSYRTPITDRHVVSAPEIEAKTVIELGSTKEPMAFTLAAVLSGRFPSPFAAGAPAPRDPLRSTGATTDWATTDEPVLSAAAETHVVVFGDADWLRDPNDPRLGRLFPFLDEPRNLHLLMNLVDWLTLDEELIALRRRVPRDRRLRDLEAEAREELGLTRAPPADTHYELEQRLRLEERARRRAARTRWRIMLVPPLASLLIVLGFGLAWNLVQRRGGRR